VAINISAAVEKLIKSPSYRPRINVPWIVSMIGAIGAIVVMILINPIAFLFAFGLEALILFLLISRNLEQQWGDSAAGIWMRISRFALLKLNSRKIHMRNWRPFMLLFINDIKTRIDVVRFAALLGQDSGILTISKLIKPEDKDKIRNVKELVSEMRKDLKDAEMEAFTEVNIVDDFKRGMYTVAASHGIAGLKTNTVVFGWSQTEDGKREELETIQKIAKLHKNILLLHFNTSIAKQKDKRIDIWWGGKEKNGDLMLLLSYLIRLNNAWQKTTINIFSVVKTESEKLSFETQIRNAVYESRISAHVELFVMNDSNFISILSKKSAEADLVFLGLAHHIHDYSKTIESIDKITKNLKAVIFVQNNGMDDEIPTIFK